MFFSKKVKKVEAYYDKMTLRYVEAGYGDVIQAHRPEDINELLAYICKNAGVKDGLNILDAGCGIGGPAVYMAKHFDVKITALTNSAVQIKMASERIEKENLKDKIKPIQADYHKLDAVFEKETFDLVLMLESYGHAVDKKLVLSGVQKVLKKEGTLYIKDYFKREITGTPERKQGLKKLIQNMNKLYSYQLPDINSTIDILRKLDFNLQYVKRNELPLDSQHYVATFEKNNDIDIFEGGVHYQFLEPLELLFKKPAHIDAPII